MQNIVIASDHAGFELKQEIIRALEPSHYKIENLGTNSIDSVDYPYYAQKTAEYMQKHDGIGILICGSGIGMSIKANRYTHIRAALCLNKEYAHLAREHNDANVLILGARFLSTEEAQSIVQEFLNTEFAADRHANRVKQL